MLWPISRASGQRAPPIKAIAPMMQHDERHAQAEKRQRLDIWQAKLGADEAGAPHQHEQQRRGGGSRMAQARRYHGFHIVGESCRGGASAYNILPHARAKFRPRRIKFEPLDRNHTRCRNEFLLLMALKRVLNDGEPKCQIRFIPSRGTANSQFSDTSWPAQR